MDWFFVFLYISSPPYGGIIGAGGRAKDAQEHLEISEDAY
jgi:hypothetical protein